MHSENLYGWMEQQISQHVSRDMEAVRGIRGWQSQLNEYMTHEDVTTKLTIRSKYYLIGEKKKRRKFFENRPHRVMQLMNVTSPESRW